MSIFLETKRLIIKQPEATDYERLFALQSDPEVMRYIGQGVRTEPEVRTGLKAAMDHHKKYGFSLGCVYEKNSRQFVGRAGLIYLGYDETQDDIEIAYALVKSAWGKGYATELASALLDWGFKNLEVERLVAVVAPDNESSKNVLKKIKMHFSNKITYNNKPADMYIIKRSFI